MTLYISRGRLISRRKVLDEIVNTWRGFRVGEEVMFDGRVVVIQKFNRKNVEVDLGGAKWIIPHKHFNLQKIER